MFNLFEFQSDGVLFPGDLRMRTPDFFRSRIDAMINLNDPLAVLAPAAVRRHADRPIPRSGGRAMPGANAQGHDQRGRGHRGRQA